MPTSLPHPTPPHPYQVRGLDLPTSPSMTRSKLKLTYIPNDSVRRASFKKRRKSIMKKVGELATLCGVDALAVVYGPYEQNPEVWPEDPAKATAILKRFQDLPQMEQRRRMMNQEEFLRSSICKAEEQLQKAKRQALDTQLLALMYQCLAEAERGTTSVLDAIRDPDVLNKLDWFVNSKMKEIDYRLHTFQLSGSAMPHSGAMATNPAASADSIAAASSSHMPPERFQYGQNYGYLENTSMFEAANHRSEEHHDFNNYGDVDNMMIVAASPQPHMPIGATNHQLQGPEVQNAIQYTNNRDKLNLAPTSSFTLTVAGGGANHGFEGEANTWSGKFSSAIAPHYQDDITALFSIPYSYNGTGV